MFNSENDQPTEFQQLECSGLFTVHGFLSGFLKTTMCSLENPSFCSFFVLLLFVLYHCKWKVCPFFFTTKSFCNVHVYQLVMLCGQTVNLN